MKTSAVFSLVVLAALAAPSAAQELVSRECLGCICEAASQCDITVGCSGGVCGPFRITNPFFVDSEILNEPAYAGQTFESCTTDPFCAAAALRKYALKYPRDCDQDGRRTCTDIAMLHLTGPGGCLANRAEVREREYWKRLERCLDVYPNA